MDVPILKQGDYLIATLQADLTDSDWDGLREAILERVGRFRTQGVVLDVTVLDVMDSFAARMLRGIAQMLELRGALAVVVGIQPDVAFSMVQLGMTLEDVQTALDLEEGLATLNRLKKAGRNHGR